MNNYKDISNQQFMYDDCSIQMTESAREKCKTRIDRNSTQNYGKEHRIESYSANNGNIFYSNSEFQLTNSSKPWTEILSLPKGGHLPEEA